MLIKMDYRRFNISQLSRETNTSRQLLHSWKRKGYLKPTQIVGTMEKYSIDAFLKAEKLHNENIKKELIQYADTLQPKRKKRNRKSLDIPGIGEKITEAHWDLIFGN